MIWDSCERLGPEMRDYAQLVLPLYAELIAMNPSNVWVSDVFVNCVVHFAATPQQTNGHDCGPAATTILIHLMRMEVPETSLDGLCFRFSHLTMVFNEMYGPCPFRLGASNETYSLPRGSLIDNDIVQLVHHVTTAPKARSRRPVIDAATIESIPSGGADHCSSLLMEATDALIPIIMAVDSSHEPLNRSDARAILWNIFARYGHAAFRQQQIETFMRIACSQTPATPPEVREFLVLIQQDSPHFGPDGLSGLSVPIVGNAGLGSLALQDLHVWFETPRQHSGAYQAWGEGVAANCVSLVCPIMRYNNCNERGQAEVSQRVSELVKAWNRAFRPGRRSPRLVVDADRWQPPRSDEELMCIEAVYAAVSPIDLLFHRSLQDAANIDRKPHYACLDTVNLASRIYSNVRLHMVLIGSSVDSMTRNPVSWT
jgi:hypothetical protein